MVLNNFLNFAKRIDFSSKTDLMEEPVIVQKHSLKMEMEAGTYFWCACGRSKNQPFCDGSHKGTAFRPVKVVLDKPQWVKWCMCRHSQEGHLCDNSHRGL